MQAKILGVLVFGATLCAQAPPVDTVAQGRIPVGVPAVYADFDGSGTTDALFHAGIGGSWLPSFFELGSFAPLPLPPVAGSAASSVALVLNANSDGIPDVLEFDAVGGFGVVLGAPGPMLIHSFAGPNWPPPSVMPAWWSRPDVGDFDGDGDDDVAWVQVQVAGGTWELRVAINDHPTWTSTATPLLPSFPNYTAGRVIHGDVDGDGYQDVLACLWRPGGAIAPDNGFRHIWIFPGQAGGGVGSPQYVTVPLLSGGAANIEIACTDVTEDGIDDLVFGTISGPSSVGPANVPLYILAGATVNPLTSPPTTFVYNTELPQAYWVADFDLDGVVDIGWVSRIADPSLPVNAPLGGDAKVRMVRGLGGGAMASSPLLLHHVEGSSLGYFKTQLGDFDGDGDPDLDLHGIGFQHETTWLRNNARRTPGCAGAGGAIPRAVIGTATLGNAGFFIGLENAAPFAAAFLGVSLNVASSAACTTALDLGALVAPTPTFGWGTTNAAGALTITVPLPSSPVWSGTSAVIQWGVIDGAGASLIAGLSMALSDARVVLMGP